MSSWREEPEGLAQALAREAGGNACLAFWGTLSPFLTDRLDTVVDPDVRHLGPFHGGRGLASARAALAALLAAVNEPRLSVLHWGWGAADHLLVRWRFTALLEGEPIAVEGMSDIRLGSDGKVVEHRDFHGPVRALAWRGPPSGP
jgi:hypothetical protein